MEEKHNPEDVPSITRKNAGYEHDTGKLTKLGNLVT